MKMKKEILGSRFGQTMKTDETFLNCKLLENFHQSFLLKFLQANLSLRGKKSSSSQSDV